MEIIFILLKIVAASVFFCGVALFIWTVFKGFQLGKIKDEKIDKLFEDECNFYERISKN